MPPPLIVDLEELDLSQVCYTQERIYDSLPQRHEFMLLQGICYADVERGLMVAFRDIHSEDWWFPGHLPARPLVPGVLLLEMSAQTSAFLTHLRSGSDSFIAFGGVDECKFRETVTAPSRLYLLCKVLEIRSRRVVSATQAICNGRLVFEAKITGMVMH